MCIEAVLFDADGVIQRRPQGWKDKLGEHLGFSGEPSDLLAEIFAAEAPALVGDTDFPRALSNILSQWTCSAPLDKALDVWTILEVDPEMIGAIRTLRQSGIRCYLASNQEHYKARYMSEVLGYCHLFETEFYSCAMGLMKPNGAYFRAIVNAVKISPSRLLFVDDRAANVDSAREVGLQAATFNLEAGREGFNQILVEYGLSGVL